MSEPTFSRGRKWRIGFNVAVALVSAFALLVMANYLAARHPVRYNWSAAASSKLSPLTTRVLSSLGTNKVKVIVFFYPKDPVFSSVASLIKDYQALAPQLDVEFVNSTLPGRANRVRADFGLAMGDGSRVIFQSNNAFRMVSGTELSDFSFTKDGVPHRSAFKGEQLFTAAIMGVTNARKMKAYFLSGHGEHNPESNDQSGYSKFVKLLNNASVDEVAVLDSLHNRDVPEDCSLLLIVGASSRFNTNELERIDRYLTRGGRLLAAWPIVFQAREPTGLENLLARWNVDVGINFVRDLEGDKVNAQDNVIIANKFGSHPIVRPLLQYQVELPLPRSVGSKAIGATRADAPKTTELIFTSEKGEALDFDGVNAIRKKVGSIPLAVAVEKGGIQGVATDAGTTRIVAMGSSVSFANLALGASANSDFATLAVNWLLNRDEKLMEIPPRAITEYYLSVTEKQMLTLRWIFIAGAPGAALLIGAFVWLKRRI